MAGLGFCRILAASIIDGGGQHESESRHALRSVRFHDIVNISLPSMIYFLYNNCH